MPFKSEKQRRYMHANLPEIAKRWERDYASGGIARVGFANGMNLNALNRDVFNDYNTAYQPMGLRGMSFPNFNSAEAAPINNTGVADIGMNEMFSYPNTHQMFPSNRYPNIHAGLEQSGADVDKYGFRQMDLENPDQDFYQSPQGLAFLRNKMGGAWGNIKDFTGNVMDKASGIFSGAKNKSGALAGNLMGMAMGIPGLGMLLGNIRPDNPYEKFQKQMFLDPEVNFMGGTRGPNKDPFGKNVRSLLGNYDVVEQFDDLAGSKLGEKYGYEDAMEDGVLTDKELEAMQKEGLKGWQLNRFKTLFEAKKRADKYQQGIANKAREERMAKERERQAQMARSNRVVLDRPQGPRGDGGGSWHGQTAAKEKAGVQVAGPGFGKGAYFSQGGLASLWPK